MDYPQTSPEELPDLYKDLENKRSDVEGALLENFNTRETDEGIRIIFADATVEDYLQAMSDVNHALVPFFTKISGYSDREFQRKYGVQNFGSRFSSRKTAFTDSDEARVFAEMLEDEMPAEMWLETALYAFFKMYENDQRRFVRMRYEETVREHLRENGIPNRKGVDLPGQPDLAVPESDPYEVTGEVRVFHEMDSKKRYKEFRDEAREAAENFPDARFIIVCNPGEYIVRSDREEVREDIRGPEMDGVYFHDELNQMVSDLKGWGVTQQETFS